MPSFDYAAIDTAITITLKERSYRIEEPSVLQLAQIASLAGGGESDPEERSRRLLTTVRDIVPDITDADLRFLLIPRVLARFLRDLSGNGDRG